MARGDLTGEQWGERRFQAPSLGLPDGFSEGRLAGRLGLLAELDRQRAAMEASAAAGGFDDERQGAVSLLTLMRTLRRRMDLSVLGTAWRKMLVGMSFSGGLLVVLGWCVSLVGLLPFVVNRSINLIDVLGPVNAGTLLFAMAGYAVLYAVLIAAFLGMLLRAVRYGVVPVRKTTGSAA